MERFMQRALENVIIAYDGSVRNSQGFLYSTTYNNGFDISKTLPVPTEEKSSLSNFIDINVLVDYQNHERGWYNHAELKKTNIKLKSVKPTFSLEDALNDMIEGTITVEPVAIASSNQNGNEKLTYFERAKILGLRANQLNNNAIPRFETELIEPLEIAKEEYRLGLLAVSPALFILRTLPNGQQVRVYPTLQNIQ